MAVCAAWLLLVSLVLGLTTTALAAPQPPNKRPKQEMPLRAAIGAYPGGWGASGSGTGPTNVQAALNDLREGRPFIKHVYYSWRDGSAFDDLILPQLADGSSVAVSLRFVPPAEYYDWSARRWLAPLDLVEREYVAWVVQGATLLRARPGVAAVIVGNEANAVGGSSDSDGWFDGDTGVVARSIARAVVAAQSKANRWRRTPAPLGVNYLDDRDFRPGISGKEMLSRMAQSAPGFWGALDFVGVDLYLTEMHGHPGPARESILRPLREEVTRAGAPHSLPLLLTEFGILFQTEANAAVLLDGVLTELCQAESGVFGLWYFPFWSDGVIPGLLREDGTYRPVFATLRACPCWR